MLGRGAIAIALAAALGVPSLGAAQSTAGPQPQGWTVVRVLKWAMLGTAVGFGGYALVHSNRGNDAYTALRRVCDETPARCEITAAGRYAEPAIEGLFQRTRREDRRAQVGIVGGQATLFGSVGLFIYDLRHARGPQNIPYPSGAAAAMRARPAVAAGVRLAF